MLGVKTMKLKNGIAYRVIGNTCVLIMTDEGKMYFLNETAGKILGMIDNGLSKTKIIRDISEEYCVTSDVIDKDYDQIINQFREMGVIDSDIDNPVNESSVSNIPSNDSFRGDLKSYCQENFIPLQCFIELTYNCNLKCKHCYVPSYNAKNFRLDMNHYKRLLDELSTMGCLEIILTGGEVLLYPKWLEICEYARKLRFSVVIKTNGTLLTNKVISDLRKLNITEVQVSLYSMNPEVHDNFVQCSNSHEKTISALQEMYQVGQSCRISCVVTMSNYKFLYGLKEFAHSINSPIGFDLIVTRQIDSKDTPLSERLTSEALNWLDKNGVMSDIIFEGSQQINGPKEFEGLIEYPSTENSSPICGAANTMMAIDYSGEVRPCITFPITIGNIIEKSLREIWWDNKEEASNIRKLRNHDFIECSGCKYVKACPRCIATIYQETGNPVGKAYFICQTAEYHYKYGE
jgi:radical SAM protein with 4Fe4S-binding SPASM domain